MKFNELEKNKQLNIIEVCINEFAQHGYDSASTNRIISKLDISKGYLFKLFDSKEKLYLFIVDYVIKEIQDWMSTLTQEEGDFFYICKRYALREIELLRLKPEIIQFFKWISKHPDHPVYKTALANSLNAQQHIMNNIFSRLNKEQLRQDMPFTECINIIMWSLTGLNNEINNTSNHNLDEIIIRIDNIIEIIKTGIIRKEDI